ncbi:MAG TPA: ABC transporter permease [Verrucomicrobiae bacterium]
MTFRTLIKRSLRYHWRAHLGVTLGAAIGSAALIGALVVGDSVRGSLRERALERVGRIEWAMPTGDRFPREKLASDLSEAFVGGVIPALQLFGVATCEGQTRANNVQILGVNESFWKLARTRHAFTNALRGGLAINRSLAAQLEAKPGQDVLLRIKKPAALSGDASLALKSGVSVTLRLPVLAVVPDSQLGTFSLQGAQGPPLTAFLQLEELQRAVELAERANLFLIGHTEDTTTSHWPNAELASRWRLADANVELRAGPDYVEMHTRRVFLDQPLALCSLSSVPDSRPIFTYLVNLLASGTNATPYSMVTAAGPPWTPADLRDDEILVSQWLAEDLQVKPGDELMFSYFDPESGARLIERTNSFRVRGIVPMEMPWADRTLMPDFPGIEKAERTSDWDAGFPLTYKIRQKDEDYWKQYRGTPKAFVTLAAGQKMWANRFGNLTAIRFPLPTSPSESRSSGRESAPSSTQGNESRLTSAATMENYHAALEKKILANLKPEELGLRFEPVCEQALKAAEQSQDFGGLFLGFSFFLIAAALLLMAMLFQLGLEQRAPEIGTLLALGFTPGQVRKLLLGEGVALAFLGGVLGALGGLAYAKAMLHGMATVWRDAVGATALNFHATAQTLVIGLFASVAVSAATIWLALRKFVRRPAAELLVGEVGEEGSRARESVEGGRNRFRVLTNAATTGWLALLAALAIVGWMLTNGDTANAGAFFGAGALVLFAGLGFVSAWLASVLRTSCPQNRSSSSTSKPQLEFDPLAGRRQQVSLASLGLRGCARRRKRSLATVAMLACGSFLIVSIGVFRLDANRDATQRSSGTGGFALIGETTLPVVQDLNSASGRDFFALREDDLQGVSFVPLRVREGDEASCLNLNRAQKPRLLGVKPELLEGRFTIASMIHGPPRNLNWQLLKSPPEPWNRDGDAPLVPAIGDANSVRWALGKKLGDTIEFRDAQGRPFKVWIVATVANSILQGQLLIDEAEFVKCFPDESGYRQFLIDAPTNRVVEVSATLSRAMQDVGLELTPAAQRLAQFNAVQNTYLGTFQVLGGLGLLLGSVGLGIVVLRNVLERRGELAVLLAVGFRKPTLQRLLLIENGALLGLGLVVGVVAAAVAVLPALLSPGTQLPWLTLGLTLAAVLLNGALWTWAATRAALRGDLLAALRNE